MRKQLMKKLFSLILIASFFSCQDHFEPKDYQGSWVPANAEEQILPLPVISFHNDSIFFTDSFTFTKGGTFEIKNGKIHTQFHNENLNNTFSFKKKDSFIFIGNTQYYLMKHWWQDYKAHYDLISIDTQNKISGDTLSKYNNGFHLFRNSSDSLKIKLNDKYGRFEDIPQFIFRTDGKSIPTNVIYIGATLKLEDLLRAYYYLSCVNQLKVVLVTKVELEKNQYHVVFDYIEDWNLSLLLQLFSDESKKHISCDFCEGRSIQLKGQAEKLIINSKNDFLQLQKIDLQKSYLISISSQLNLKDYLEFKQILKAVKHRNKAQIRTEFF